MKTYKFGDYLIQKFRDWYSWLDDNWPDAEEKWFSDLDWDELIEYFQEYMRKTFCIHTSIEDDVNCKMEALKFIYSLL